MAIVPPTPTKTWTGEDVDELERRVRAVELRLEHGAVPGGELVARVAWLEFERKLLTGVKRATIQGNGAQGIVRIRPLYGPIEIHALDVVKSNDDGGSKLLTIVAVRAGKMEHVNSGCGDVIFPIFVRPDFDAEITIENRTPAAQFISLVYRYLDVDAMKLGMVHG